MSSEFFRLMDWGDVMDEQLNLPLAEGGVMLTKTVCPHCGAIRSYTYLDTFQPETDYRCEHCGKRFDPTKEENGLMGIYYHGSVKVHEHSTELVNLRRRIDNATADVNRLKKLFFAQPDVHCAVSNVVDLWNTRLLQSADLVAAASGEPGEEGRQMMWDANIGENAPFIKKGTRQLWGTGTGKIAILVAPGPSLKKNMHLFKHIDKSKYVVIGCNAMPKEVTPYLDYYMVGDYLGDDGWVTEEKDFSNTTALYRVCSAHKVCVQQSKDKFKEILWWRSFFDRDNKEKREYEHLAGYVMVITIFSAMLHVAIRLGCKRYIMVGYDCSYPGNEAYIGKKLEDVRQVHPLVKERDIHGQTVMTMMPYVSQCHYITRLCYLGATLHNCTFKNCTEGGIFHDYRMPFHFIEGGSLADELGVRE